MPDEQIDPLEFLTLLTRDAPKGSTTTAKSSIISKVCEELLKWRESGIVALLPELQGGCDTLVGPCKCGVWHEGGHVMQKLVELRAVVERLAVSDDGVVIAKAGDHVFLSVEEFDLHWLSGDQSCDAGVYEMEFVRKDDDVWGLLAVGGCDTDHWDGEVWSTRELAEQARDGGG